MGTWVAPTYANLFMSDFEERHVYTYPHQPLVWLRFIDDVFYIWPHGQSELDKFVHHLNSVHDTIQFTNESSIRSVNFLDACGSAYTKGQIPKRPPRVQLDTEATHQCPKGAQCNGPPTVLNTCHFLPVRPY